MLPLKVSNITKSFDYSGSVTSRVISDLSFEVRPEEIYAIVGLNGVGKSTVIKSILSLTTIDSGEILIFGSKSTDYKSRSNVFYLPEKFQPPKNLTGIEFLKHFIKIYTNQEPHKDQINLTCLSLDFDPTYLKKKIGTYSKGTVQKLGLILCFLSGAKLLILDEPSSGLDIRARDYLAKTITAYKNCGNSILLTSHILSEISAVATRIGIFHRKKIFTEGTQHEIINRHNFQSLEEVFLNVVNH